MTLNYVTITSDISDGSATSLNGYATFTPSETVYAANAPLLSASNPVTATIASGQIEEGFNLLATDNEGLTYLGQTGFFYWTVAVTVNGVTQPSWAFFLPSSPNTADLFSLANTSTPIASGGAALLAGAEFTGPVSNTSDNYWALDSFAGTDDQKMSSALAAVTAGNGGTIKLAARSHTFSNQWSTSWVSNTAMCNIVIEGSGQQVAGNLNSAPTAGVTTCTMNYSGSGAGQMDFQHTGLIELRNICFVDPSYTVPFLFVTNPVPDVHDCSFVGSAGLNLCVKDAIVLGANTTNGSGGGDNVKFGGYGGRIHHNFFSQIRRAVTFGAGCNAMDVFNNEIDELCGGVAPFYFNGNSTHPNTGNVIHHNHQIELSYYQAVVSTNGSANAKSNHIGPNSAFDANNTLIAIWDSTCLNNTIEDTTVRPQGANWPSVDPSLSDTVYSATTPNSSATGWLAYASDVIVRNQGARGPWGEGYYGDKAGLVGTNNNSLPADSGALVTVAPGTRVADASTYSGSPYVVSASLAAFTNSDVKSFCLTLTSAIPSDTFIIDYVVHSTLRYVWQASAAYSLGQVIAPAVLSSGVQVGNGHLYQCTAAGTSGTTAPTWPTNGSTVTDGTAVWTDIGANATAAICSSNATATTTSNTFCWSRPQSAVQMTKFMNHHIIGSGAAPSYAVQTDAGTGATVSVTGTDLGHIVTLTTGTGPIAGLLVKGTPGNSFTGAGASATFAITPQNAATTGLGLYGTFAGNLWNISAANTPAASTSYAFMVTTIG